MIEQLDPGEFSDWLERARAHGRPLVLDVREPHEVQTASIQADGFELLTIPMGSITTRLAEIPTERPIACLCHHGARSMRVAMFLAQQGYKQVANIAGGIEAWSVRRDTSVPRY